MDNTSSLRGVGGRNGEMTTDEAQSCGTKPESNLDSLMSAASKSDASLRALASYLINLELQVWA